MSESCRNGRDDPGSPVWDADAYLIGSYSGPVVHAAEGSRPVCDGHEHGCKTDSLNRKDAATIPRGYHPVCSACDRLLSSRE